jgi:hypothetical protein
MRPDHHGLLVSYGFRIDDCDVHQDADQLSDDLPKIDVPRR